jgi:hypothetical protein
MKPFPRFLSVFRFESGINPFLWFFPASGLIIPLFLNQHQAYGSLASLNQPTQVQFIALLAAFILAPDFMNWIQQPKGMAASEFILTRAVGRNTVYAAKLSLFYMLALLPLVITGLLAALHPQVTLHLWDEQLAASYLEKLPGSQLLPRDPQNAKTWSILIPHGLFVAALGNLSYALLIAGISQALISFLRPRKFRLLLFLLFIVLTAGFPGLLLALSRESREGIYLWFALHPFLFFSLGAAFVLALQPACFQKYRQVEFP